MKIIGAAGVVLMAFACPVWANLLTNGGFEDGFAGWTHGAVYSGYDIISDYGAWDGVNALAVGGGGHAGVGEGAWIQQSTSLTPGEYRLDLAAQIRAVGSDGRFGESGTQAHCIYRLELYVDGALKAWSDYLDDTSPYDYDNDTGWLPLTTEWTGLVQNEVSVVARLNGGDWLFYPGYNPYTLYRFAMMDGVDLQAVNVPEPATVLLLMAAGVVVIRRR